MSVTEPTTAPPAEPAVGDPGEIAWYVNGHRRSCNLTAINGVEWREAKLATGQRQAEIMTGCINAADFEAIAALIWVWEKRENPELEYMSVLAELSYDSLGLQIETSPEE